MDEKDDATKPVVRRRWRPWRFSLLGLLTVVTVFCLGLGYLVNGVSRERRVATEIKRAYGQVTFGYRYEYFDGAKNPTVSPMRVWFRRNVGDELFREVQAVRCRSGWFTDETAREVGKLRGLKRLDLVGVRISDAGVAHFAGLSQLEFIDLSRSRITDDGLKYLVELPNLRELRLWGTELTDASVARLRSMTQLTTLNLDSTGLSQDAIDRLQNALPNTSISFNAP